MNRKSWVGKGSRHERGYGAAWVRQRELALKRDCYLCRPCSEQGRVTPAREVDHIQPKEQGGTDELANLQSICRACHADKTSAEGHEASARRNRGEGFGIPDGMKRSAISVIVIAGPPGSGRAAHARKIKRTDDAVIDLDDIAEAICGQRWTDDPATLRRAIDERDRALCQLHSQRKGRCLLIVTAPTPAHRKAWMTRLGMRARLVVMQVSAAECLRRIKADPARAHAVERQAEVIRTWC